VGSSVVETTAKIIATAQTSRRLVAYRRFSALDHDISGIVHDFDLRNSHDDNDPSVDSIFMIIMADIDSERASSRDESGVKTAHQHKERRRTLTSWTGCCPIEDHH